jgi:prephenate dehydrogenase
MGLALAGHVRRVGYDRALEVQQKARKLGAFESVHFNLHAAVENADAVLLCTPLSEIEEILKLIAPDLREGALVMDTAPVKTPVAEWFQAYVPAGRHYIGLLPALNPDCLADSLHGPDSARADLFERGTLGIAAPAGTPETAVNLALSLAEMLGAQPLFLELLEADGMLAVSHILPQLAAAALLNATTGQAGWPEARRLAGRPYALGTAPVFEESLESLSLAARLNRENVLRALEMTIGGLSGIHAALKDANDEDLQRRLGHAVDDRLTWWQERQSADWSREKPSQAAIMPDVMERLFGSLFARKKKP